MKSFSLALLQRCGAFDLARAMSSGLGRILMYHNFSKSDEPDHDAVLVSQVKEQFEYLRQHFQVVPLSILVDQLASGQRLEHRVVALTVDDGRRNFYECFYPLLTEFSMPATFFVVTSFLGGQDWIWTDKVLWLAEQSHRPDELAPERIERFFATLSGMAPEARDRHIAALATGMETEIPAQPPSRYASCTWSELQEMADSGLVEIGSHTVNHPVLSSLNEEESLWQLTESRAQIERNLGRKVKCFCFPNGKQTDYRAIHLRQVQEAGYASAVSAQFGMVSEGSNIFELPRIGVSGASNPLSFAKDIDGAAYYHLRIRASLGLRRATI